MTNNILQRALALSLLITTAISAQAGQAGDADRDYEINFTGRQRPSVVDTPLVPTFELLQKRYTTSTPLAPVLWAGATEATIDWLPGLTMNSVDLGPAGLEPLLDGWSGTGLLALLLRTDATGVFSLDLAMDAGLAGTEIFTCMAHFSPVSADGFFVSQTHRFTFRQQPGFPPIFGETVVNTATVINNVLPLGFPFPFYGASYTQLNLAGSLPGLELGGNLGSNTPWSVGSFITQWPNPVIYPYALPASNPPGTVSFFTNGTDAAVVTWNGATGGVSQGEIFTRVILSAAPPAPTIQFEYGALELTGAFTSQLIVVGLNPGTAQVFAPQATPIDLSEGGNVFTSPDVVPFEVFFPTPVGLPGGGQVAPRVSDLRFRSVTWVLDAQGFPVLQM